MPYRLVAEAEAFCPTNAGGYGSLLSQGRRKRIRSSNSKHAFALAARCARVVLESFARLRAWGMPGARCTRSLVCSVLVAHECRHHGRTGSPGIPARNGFNGLYRALPGDEFVLSPSSADEGFAGPGWANETSANLTPATGARTTRFCRPQKRRSSACRRLLTGLVDPPCHPVSRPALPRPPHPIPTFVTMANAPREG